MPILVLVVLSLLLVAITFLVVVVIQLLMYAAVLAAVVGVVYLCLLAVQRTVEGVQRLAHRRELARRAPARQVWVAFHAALDAVEARAFADGRQDDERLRDAAPARELELIHRAQASNRAAATLVGELAAMADITALHPPGSSDRSSTALPWPVLDDREQVLRDLAAVQPLSIPHPALTALVHAPLWHVLTQLHAELTRHSPDYDQLQAQHHLAQGLSSPEAAT